MRKHLKYASLLVAVGTIGLSQVAKAEDKEGGSFWDNTKVTGSLDTSYNYNFNRPSTGPAGTAAANGYRGFDVNANNFSLNLFELAIENAPTDWITLRTDLDFGSDAKVVAGTENWGGAQNTPFNLQQAFIAVKAPIGNGMTFKAGKFVTLHGIEVIESAYNSNISRGFLFNYAIPFTHTGIMMNYAFSDMVSLDLGVVNGWNSVIDTNNGKSVHGQLSIKPVEGLTWNIGATVGPETANIDRTIRSLINSNISYTINDQWNVAVDYALGRDGGFTGTKTQGISDWQTVAAYINWKALENFGLSLRGEFYKDDVGTLGAPTGSTASTKVGEGTLTTHYYIADGLDLRFEFRHDQGNQASFLKGNGTSKKYQDTIASQLVYSF